MRFASRSLSLVLLLLLLPILLLLTSQQGAWAFAHVGRQTAFGLRRRRIRGGPPPRSVAVSRFRGGTDKAIAAASESRGGASYDAAKGGVGDDDSSSGGSPQGEPLVDAPMPEYSERALARGVFSDLFFYHGSEHLRSHLAGIRTEKTLGVTRTVGDVRRECYRNGEVLLDAYPRSAIVVARRHFSSSSAPSSSSLPAHVVAPHPAEADAHAHAPLWGSSALPPSLPRLPPTVPRTLSSDSLSGACFRRRVKVHCPRLLYRPDRRRRNAGMASFMSSGDGDGGDDDDDDDADDDDNPGDEGDRGGRSPDELVDAPMPEYREHAVARDVFSSLYFFHGSELMRSQFAAGAEPLGGRRTVGDVRRECYRIGERVEDVLYDRYGVPYRSYAYLNAGDVATLQSQKRVALNAHHEVRAFEAARRRGTDPDGPRQGSHLPAFEEAYVCGTDNPHCYTSPECYVTGPSRSGKTFFALEYLAGFRGGDERVLPEVALYLQPAEVPELTSPQQKSGWGYANGVVDWIRRELEHVLQRKIMIRLPMHVCLVFDNAGDLRLDGAFLDRHTVRSIRSSAERSIAERVVVVMAGTGLITDSIVEGRGGAYHFRMKPLQRDDLDRMICNRLYDAGVPWYRFEGGIPVKSPKRTARAIAGAVEAQPALLAAARNTQMATDVVDAIMTTILPPEARYEGRYLAEHWSAQVGAGAAGLLRDALRGYVESSSLLASLDPSQRRRVAVWTLWMLNSTKKWAQSPSRPGHFRYPEFPGLSGREREAAMAMVEINTVQYRDWWPVVRFEKYVATIVPANLLVLFYLLGVPTSVLTGWPTNDAGTALHAVLQWIVKKVQTHHDTVVRPLQKSFCPEFDFDREESTLTAFESKLAEKGDGAVSEYRSAVEKHEASLESSLREVPLELLPPWELRAEDECIRLPRSSRESILICHGDDLPDVVAPYLFLRAVRGAGGGGGETIRLKSELRRCCLLSDRKEDDRLLRGFLAIWGGAFGDASPDDGEGEFLIDRKGRVKVDAKLRLPKVRDCGDGSIRYVLTTRAGSINVALPTGHVLKVEERMLDSDKQLGADPSKRWSGKLEPDAAAAWTQFVKGQVRRQVKVQFLFLKSGISPLDATSTRQRCDDE